MKIRQYLFIFHLILRVKWDFVIQMIQIRNIAADRIGRNWELKMFKHFLFIGNSGSKAALSSSRYSGKHHGFQSRSVSSQSRKCRNCGEGVASDSIAFQCSKCNSLIDVPEELVTNFTSKYLINALSAPSHLGRTISVYSLWRRSSASTRTSLPSDSGNCRTFCIRTNSAKSASSARL